MMSGSDWQWRRQERCWRAWWISFTGHLYNTYLPAFGCTCNGLLPSRNFLAVKSDQCSCKLWSRTQIISMHRLDSFPQLGPWWHPEITRCSILSWTLLPRGGTSANELSRGRNILHVCSADLSKRGSKMTMLLFLMVLLLEVKAGADKRMEPATYWV